MKCELCGGFDAENIVDIEGSEMKACGNCSSYGKLVRQLPRDFKRRNQEVKQNSHKVSKTALAESHAMPTREEIIVDEFASIIRKSRERRDMTAIPIP